jgi:iron-sulfur cluster repair protein YtfE (RIC family)
MNTTLVPIRSVETFDSHGGARLISEVAADSMTEPRRLHMNDVARHLPKSESTRTETRLVALTLRTEHALLLEELTNRAEDLLRKVMAGQWPQAELRAFVDYLHLELLRHIADEEWLLFRASHHAPDDLHRLRQDHLDLRRTIEVLTEAAASGSTSSPEQLSHTTRHLLTQLEDHMVAEQELLAAHGEAPSTASLGSRPHAWFALTEGPVINLNDLPGPVGVDAVLGRLLRLRPGEQVEVWAGTDPSPVWNQLAMRDPGRYGFSYLKRGPDQWRVQITRRPAQ